MTTACIITYNDMPLICECINSLKGKCSRIIAIDGRFPDFEGRRDVSDDGTFEYLSSVGVEVYIFPIDEIDKRNKYLDLLHTGDDCLIIDADERLVGDIPELTVSIGQIKIQDVFPRQKFGIYHRYFKYRKGLHYSKTHSRIVDKNGDLFCEPSQAGYPHTHIKSFYLEHHRHSRSPKRQEAKEKYYEILRKKEL